MADALFAGYRRHPADDEMFERSGEVRRHCLTLYDELRAATAGDRSSRRFW